MIVTVARHTFRVSYLMLGLLLIVVALFTLVARVGLPLVANQKASIESRVSDYLKSPVDIGELSLRWRGFGPQLHASNVAVFETSDRLVALNELLIDVDLASTLLRGIPIINELSLVGARLAIEADAGGRIRLHGMEAMSAGTTSVDVIAPDEFTAPGLPGVDVMSWLFNARKVALLDTELTLIDSSSLRQYVVKDLNIRAENSDDVHKLRVDAVLPDAVGGRLEAGIDLTGDARTLSESDGDWYMAADEVSVHGLTTLLGSIGLLDNAVATAHLHGSAGMELWGQWREGRLVMARGPIVFNGIVDTNAEQTQLDTVSVNMNLVNNVASTDIDLSEINASLGSQTLQIEAINVSRKRLATHQVPDADAPLHPLAGWTLEVLANELNLALSTRLAALALSIQPEASFNAWSEKLSKARVDGVVRELVLSVAGTSAAPSINIAADIDGVSMQGDTALPSFGPVNGTVLLVESKGQLQLSSEQMPLAWSKASDVMTLNVDVLDATLDINLQNPEKLLIGARLQLDDNGIETSSRIKATWTPGLSPHLDMQSRFSATDITQLKAWLPRKRLSAAATRWIDRAIVSGEAKEGSLIFFGHVQDFPFADGEGVFRASAAIRNGELSFLPTWPSASDINGQLELDGLRISGVANDSILNGFNVTTSRVVIDNLAAPMLQFSTTADGVFQEVAEFAVTGPLQEILKPAIGDMSGTGNVQMDLALTLPLFAKPANVDASLRARVWKPFDINGALFVNDNDVTFSRAGLVLKDAAGAVKFNKSGVAVDNLRGKLLGHSVRLTGRTEGQGASATTTIRINGSLEANDLLAHYGNPLDQFVRGSSVWDATVRAPHTLQRLRDEGVSLTLESNLLGSQLLLPAPLGKSSSTDQNLQVRTAFRVDSNEQIWHVAYAEQATVGVKLLDDTMKAILIDLGDGGLAADATRSIPDGIRLQGDVPGLAADRWIETIAGYIDSLPTSTGEPQLTLPVSLALNTQSLILGNRIFGKAQLRANTDDTYINFAVFNKAVQGNMRYPRKHWQQDTALKVRVEYLDWSVIDALSESEPDANAAASDGLDPRVIPPIEARIAALTHNDVRIRDLVFRTEPNISGLHVTTLGFAYDTMRMVGQGHWYLRDPQGVSSQLTGKHDSQLNLVLQSDDFGVGFDEIGLDGIINDGQGSVQLQLAWPAPLYSPDIAVLDGNVTIDMQAGSIVPLEPGGGRVVGLFALQALPRRLNLDFKDLTGDGLAFKSIAGSAIIEDGIADVSLLQLTGPIGVVDIMGQSDLTHREFDQQVTVLPRVSAALPIIGAISGGASAGIGALIAAGFLKAIGVDFDRIGLRNYRLTGPWTDPVFTSVSSDFSRQR